MNIKSIEPTPSPNTMKVLLDEELPFGKSHNYKANNIEGAPKLIQQLMNIEGVKAVYHVADFLAVERNAKYDWQTILANVRYAFGAEQVQTVTTNNIEQFGEVKVFLQMLFGLPMQLKLIDGEQEIRVGLPERFIQAITETEKYADNIILERKWIDKGIRYGTPEEIGEEMVTELSAAYSEERLQHLVNLFKSGEKAKTKLVESYPVTVQMMDNSDWTKRYAALEQMSKPTEADLLFLAKAIYDEKVVIRRLATAYLGELGGKAVLPLLYEVMNDKIATVRRTAGDCLSDIGDAEAMSVMIRALEDSSKLVRWRAAMFLYEVGDRTAVEFLKKAENDPEFEVQMQVKMALERIEGGEEAKGSVWKQMTENRKK